MTIPTPIPPSLQLNAWTFIFDLPKCLEVINERISNGSEVDVDLLNEIIQKLNESND